MATWHRPMSPTRSVPARRGSASSRTRRSRRWRVGARSMARPPAEIGEEICDHLRPWKRRAIDRAEVEKCIALLVRTTAEVKQWPRDTGVREAVRDARAALKRLRKTLAAKPLRTFVGPKLHSVTQKRVKVIPDP